MTSHLLIFMSFMAFRFVSCQPTKCRDSEGKPNNIPEMLDWIYHLSDNYPTYKMVFQKQIKSIVQKYDLPEYEDLEADIYQFVTKMSNVRALLVKERNEMEDWSKIKIPLQLYIACFFTLKIFFDDLRYNFIKCKYTSSDKSITRAKDSTPFEWVDYDYFTNEMLKDVEIKDLEEMLDEIYKEDIFSKRFLEFCSTVHFLAQNLDIGAKLAFIDRLAMSSKAIDMLRRFLEAEDGGVLSSNSIALIESLRRLGEPGSPLRKLMDKNNNKALNSYDMILYKYAVFMERHAPRYLKLLSDGSRELLYLLPMTYRYFKILTFEEVIILLRDEGLMFNSGNIDLDYLDCQFSALTASDGHMKMLADAAYRHGLYVTFNRSPDEFSGHLRSSIPPASLVNTEESPTATSEILREDCTHADSSI